MMSNLLETPNRSESCSSESDPEPYRRIGSAALLLALAAVLIAAFFLLAAVRGRPVGTPILVLVAYTFLFALLAFKSRVPLDRLTRGRFLLQHCLVLAIVYAITTEAVAAYPHLPTWFTAMPRHGRGFSFFGWCLIVISLVLAFCECSWVFRDEGEQVSKAEQSS